MKNVIYKIDNIRSAKCYIGSAVDFKSRKRMHLHNLRTGTHHSAYLQRAYNIQGEQDFVFSIIESDIPRTKLLEREQFYIDLFNPVYNVCKVAGSRMGIAVTEQAKNKQREKMQGRHFHTPESKAAISNSLIGNRRQVGNINRRKVTPEIIFQVNEMRASGLGCRKIAAATGLNKTTILNIFNNKFNYG